MGIVDAIFFCLMALGFPFTLWGLMLDMTKSKLNWSAGKSSCSKWSKLSADRGWDKPVMLFFFFLQIIRKIYQWWDTFFFSSFLFFNFFLQLKNYFFIFIFINLKDSHYLKSNLILKNFFNFSCHFQNFPKFSSDFSRCWKKFLNEKFKISLPLFFFFSSIGSWKKISTIFLIQAPPLGKKMIKLSSYFILLTKART